MERKLSFAPSVFLFFALALFRRMQKRYHCCSRNGPAKTENGSSTTFGEGSASPQTDSSTESQTASDSSESSGDESEQEEKTPQKFMRFNGESYVQMPSGKKALGVPNFTISLWLKTRSLTKKTIFSRFTVETPKAWPSPYGSTIIVLN